MWTVCLCISVLIWCMTIVASVIIALHKYKSNRIINSTNVLAVGTFISAVIMFLPLYADVFDADKVIAKIFKTFIISVHHTIRLFVVDSDFDCVQDIIREGAGGVSGIYAVFFTVLFITAPILTFGFIMSFFKNLASYRRYFTGFFKDVYVFSELNDRSLALASSIMDNNSNTMIVFTDVFDKNEETEFELIEQAKQLGAIMFKKDILSVKFSLHSAASRMYFFIMGEDDSENLRHSLGIIENYKNRDNTRLYIFSNSVSGSLLLSSKTYNTGKVVVRRINSEKSLIYRTLYDKGTLLFDNAVEYGEHEKVISAVVIGTGNYGNEMIKALSWYCQMDGYRVSIDAFDKDEKAGSKFTAQCPELMDERYNGIYVDNCAQYYIKIHSGMDVDTIEFADEIKKLKDTTYVFVALGSDDENIKTAVDLRIMFARMGLHPTIQAVVYDTEKKDALEGIANFKNQTYDIEFIGDLKSTYSEEVIIDTELEDAAIKVHKQWPDGKTEQQMELEFFRYEYFYMSSTATAIHNKAKVTCKICGAHKEESERTPEETDRLAKIEHCRWNAYMRSNGYIYGEPRSDLAKMHNNLVNYDDLSEEDKNKDIRVINAEKK